MIKYLIAFLLICSNAFATSYELSTGNVGVNTASPTATLGVGGNAAIGGVAYTSAVAPPTNGLIVQGNVGIGSVTPGQNLDIQGTARAITFIGALTGNASTSTTAPSNAVLATGTVTGATSQAQTFTNGIISNGNVGIGSSHPGQILDIQGSIRSTFFSYFNGTTLVNNLGALALLPSPGAAFYDSAGSAGSVNQYLAKLGSGNYQWTNPSTAGWIVSGNNVYTAYPGNVGIGTVTPGVALDIKGTIRTNGWLQTGGGAAVLVGDSNGNFGIGSITPGAQLDVNGTIRAIGIALPGGAQGQVIMQNAVGIGTWSTFSSGGGAGTPGGSSPQIQFNNASSFAGITGSGTDGTNLGIGSVNPEYGLVSYSGAKFITVSPPSPDSSFRSNVGIGTAYPGGVLDVEGTASSIVFNGLPATYNVGIASFNPGKQLDVAGTIRTQNFTMSQNNPTINYVLTATDTYGDTSWEAAQGGGTASWTVSGNNVYTAYPGNVGIGSWTPGQVLDVNGTARILGNLGIGIIPNAPLEVQGSLMTIGSGNSTFNVGGGNFGINSLVPGQVLDVQGTARMLSLAIGTNPVINSLSALDVEGTMATSTAGLHVTYSGNVGIGTFNPGTNVFQEVGAGSLAGGSLSWSPGGSITATAIGFSSASPSLINSSSTAGSKLTITGGNSPTSMLALNSTGKTGNGDMVYMSWGNVGIGTEMLDMLNGGIGIGTSASMEVLGTLPPMGGITMQGNLGIGTWVPAANLDIEGSANIMKVGGVCNSIGPVGACWTNTGQIGYCSGALGACTTCTTC